MRRPAVMIVEDEVLVALQLEEKLPPMGYDVVASVTTGEEAIEMADRLPLDLIIMDIRLDGEIDGIKAAEQILSRHEIPIIYLTAHSDDSTLRRAKSTVPSGYLVKPFCNTELRTAIDSALQGIGRIEEVEETVRLVSSPLSTLGGAVIITGEDGAITYMNSFAERLTAWRHEDALGKNLTDVYVLKDGETGSMVDSHVSTLLNRGSGSTPSQYVLVAKDSSETPIEQSVIPVNDFSGALSKVMVGFHDVNDEGTANTEWSDYASRLYLAGVLCCADGEFAKAKSFYQRALLILEMNLDADHPKVARIRRCLMEIYERRRRSGEGTSAETTSERV